MLSCYLLGTSEWCVLSKVLDEEETSEPLDVSQLQQEYEGELTYPDITSEPDSKDGGEDYNSLGPELITVLILPVSERLHQEDATARQLCHTPHIDGELTA